jgi:hypothetical protein
MSQTLSKKAYLSQNKARFDQLGFTPRDRAVKYTAYLADKQSKGLTPKQRVYQRTINPTPNRRQRRRRNNNNNNNGRITSLVAPPRQTKMSISECTLKFAAASMDPFDSMLNEVCIPDSNCVPSFKFKTRLECDMQVGTEGIGFVAFNPFSMMSNDNGILAATWIDYPIVTSSPSYSFTDFAYDETSITGGTANGFNSNSPYTSTYLSDPANVMRLVAAGVEIEYSGKLMDQAGVISTLQNNGLIDFGSITVADFRKNPRTRTCGNSKDNRCYISYMATGPEFYEYKNFNAYRPSSRQRPGELHYNPLLILVSAATAGTSFKVSAVSYFEAQLKNTTVTPSESDPTGWTSFNSARSSVPSTPDPSTDLKNVITKTKQNMSTNISGLIAPLAETGVTMLTGNPAAGKLAGTTAELISNLFGNA